MAAKKKLLKAQKGATTADSLFIYNNALQQKAYYDKFKPYYKKPEISTWNLHNDYVKEKELDHLKYRMPSSWTAQEKAKFNNLKTQIKNNPDPNKSYILDIITGALDPNAPALVYDRRIKPQGEISYEPKYYTTSMGYYIKAPKSDISYLVKDAKLSKDEIAIFDEIRKTKNDKLALIYDTYGPLTTAQEKDRLYKWAKSRGLSENAMKSLVYKKTLENKQRDVLKGYSTTLPYYDPLAVKPANMLTDAEFKKRYEKYGPSGLPQSRITKLGLKPKTTTNTTTNKPNNKTVPKKEEREELVLKTKPAELLPINVGEQEIIPQTWEYNMGRGDGIVLPESRKQWKQNPATGTWYEIERPVDPRFSPKYNLSTGSYQSGGYIDLDLTPEEIEQYKKGGYIVEELPTAQEGLDTGVVESKTPWETAPEEFSPNVYEGKEVTVKAKAPEWAKYQKEYETSKPWEDFLYDEQRKYLRHNKGLNKAAGVSMDNFPQAERIRIKQEYDQKMNDYITRRLGKSRDFNPRRRGEWVDQLTDREKQIVAGSRYGSKLRPDVWSRFLSGARSTFNFLSPNYQITGDVPGMTKKENKEAMHNWMEGLELMAPTEIPGIVNANYLTNSNPRLARPGYLSGEYMNNVSPLAAAVVNPFTYVDAATGLMELPHLLSSGANTLMKGSKYIGEGLSGAKAAENIFETAKPIAQSIDNPLTLSDIRTNELAKGRPFATFDEGVRKPLRAESFYDPGNLNLTPGTEAHSAYETMRLQALGAEQPLMKFIPLDGSKYVRDPENLNIWRKIDADDLADISAEEMAKYGLDENAFAFKPPIKREVALTAENENLINSLKTAKQRAEATGNTELANTYDAKIKEIESSATKAFDEPYTGSEAIKDVKGSKLNMFEPTPGEEYAMLKDIDPTDAKKEVYQTISDAIEDTRANKVEKWKTAEGQKRLQNMIDTTPYLKNIGMTPESYVESIVNLENANKTYLEKLMDLDKINEKMLNLDRQNELGYIDDQFYWDQIMDLEKEVLSKRDEIADIRGEINSSGKYNAFMEGTGKIGIGENIDPHDLKQTIEHEISHLLQAGSKTSLDKELSRLKLIEDDLFSDLPLTFNPGKTGWLDFINSPEYLESSKQYFKFEAEGREKLAMVSELRQDLLDRGIIKDMYDKITPQMLEKHFDKYMSKGTGKKTIPLRVYDIMEDDESNFKVLANVLNKLPVAVPISIGVGTAVGAGMQGTEQRQLGQLGPQKFKSGGSMELDLSPEEIEWYIKNGYTVEDI